MINSKKIFSQNGSTLIEAMIAIGVLTIGIFAAMTMQLRAISASSSAINRTHANNVAVSLLETLKQLDFDDPNLSDTTNLVQGDANDATFTATLKEMANIIQVGPVAGTVVDRAGVTYQLSWDVQDNILDGAPLDKTIRIYLTWGSLMGQNHLEMTTVKYNNISL